MAYAINKMSGVVNWINICGVRTKTIHKTSEASNIVRNGGSLAQVKELSDQQLMLITVKTGVKFSTEGFPRSSGQGGLHRLPPVGSIPLKVHMSDTNPHVRLSLVHFEVIDAAGSPQTSVLTIELWER